MSAPTFDMRMPALPIPIILSIFALSLVPLATQAQQPAQPVESKQNPAPFGSSTGKLYRVEAIVFNYLGPIPAGGEIWHREPRIRFDRQRSSRPLNPSAPGYSSSESIDAAANPVEQNPVRFTELSNLAPHLSKLQNDPRYEVVTYTAWIQPLFEKRNSVSVPIRRQPKSVQTAYGISPPIRVPLSGSIQIFGDRLLFVDVDITNEYFEESSAYSTAAPPNRPPGEYNLREKRRVKLNELHYFDHPFFGLLIRVSRYEPGMGASGG